MRDITGIDPGTCMSGAVVHNHMVYVSGQVALDAGGATVTVQTKNILSRIDALLAMAGTDKTHLASASIWLADISTFEEFNAVWDAWIPAGSTPRVQRWKRNSSSPNSPLKSRSSQRSDNSYI